MWLKRAVLFTIFLINISFVQTKNLNEENYLIQVPDTAYVTETCKEVGCKNGGTCTTDESGNTVCKCREGSDGNLCENVFACNNLKFQYCQGLHGTCELGNKPYEAICKCNDDKKFHNTLHICKDTCEEEDCKNGANCTDDGTGSTFCECREGSSGDFCETVYACRNLKFKYCNGDNGTCVLAEKSHEALCECHGDKKFDDNLDACRETCKDDDCKNGANCTDDGTGNTFCECREGSTGDLCDIVYACRHPKFTYCKGYNGTCILGKESHEALCQCHGDKKFDDNIGVCRELCNDDVCKNGANCTADVEGNKFCKCRKGSTGDFCEIVDECRRPKFKYCKRHNGTCVLGDKPSTAICQCKEDKEFDENLNECRENKCKISCGEKKDVKCDGDPYGKVDVICTCKDNSKEFDQRDKSCKENKCKISCGEKIDVKCDGDPYGKVDVICTCKDKSKEFDPRDKSCKENKCKISCGEMKEAKCIGDPYGEVDVICICEDKSKEFDPRDKSCKVINECENPSACPNTTYCMNTYGSYSCFCKDGFKQKSPHSITKEDGCEALCDPNPCRNDGECINVGSHGFTCRCTKPYGGLLCNETSVIIDGVPDNKYAIICGVILITLLIISIVVGIVLHIKMKKYKDRNAYLSSELRRNQIEMNRFDCNEQHNFRR